MSQPMRTSPAGIALIKRHEGLRLGAYHDAAGILTIGYGHTGPDVAPNQKITQHEADTLLIHDIKTAESCIRKHANRPPNLPLSQPQFDALVSFQFNTGGFKPGNGIYRAVTAGLDDRVDDEMRRWVHITRGGKKIKLAGLVTRRGDEAALWLSGSSAALSAQEALSTILPVATGDGTSTPSEPTARPVASNPGVATASGITVAALASETAQQLQPLAGYSTAITTAFIVLSLIGIAWTAVHAWNRR